MISNGLLFELAFAWQKPYFKIKLFDKPEPLYGRFSVQEKRTMPYEFLFDSYTEEHWQELISNKGNSLQGLKVTADNIESIELVAFERIERPEKAKKHLKRKTKLTTDDYWLDTLDKLDLVALGIQKHPPILLPVVWAALKR